MKHGEMAKHAQKTEEYLMWYVIQVRSGTETHICCQCQRLIEEGVLERCFLPRYQEKKRFQGKWHLQEKILFPGYVFLITEELEKLRESLRQVNGLTKLLGTGDEIVSLTDAEVAFLLRMGKEEQTVEMSTGIIVNDKVQIQQGPLMGMEGCIRKIDRHKRCAWLEVEMFGRMVEMKVGLEIVARVSI